ncbi:hypothetical protein ACVYF0_16720 [Vibrio cholerae]
MIVTKFEVAERQLLQAIKMFFNHDDEISIHTLSEAANQVFYDIGGDFKVASMFRDSQFVSKEVKKTFLKHWFKSRNFFKHADRDKYEKHEFHEIYNHFSLLDGANMHYKIKGSMVPETLCLNVWIAHAYPEMVLKGSFYDQIVNSFLSQQVELDPSKRWLIHELICQLRSGDVELDGVVLEFGL